MKMCCYLTWKCMQKCDFCGLKRNFCHEVSVEKWKEAISAVMPEFVVLFGGDPMLYEGHDELCEWLFEQGIDFTTFNVTGCDVEFPTTVSIDSLSDERSLWGFYAAAKFDCVANVQITRSNCQSMLKLLRLFDNWGVKYLIDLHHCGVRKDGELYMLRTPYLGESLMKENYLRLRDFFSEEHEGSLESTAVYEKVLDATKEVWKCDPEKSVGYLTLAPDTSLMACVDLKLGKKLWAKDWPDVEDEYIQERCRVRDELCYGCWWRHEISSSMLPEDACWDIESMLKRKNDYVAVYVDGAVNENGCSSVAVFQDENGEKVVAEVGGDLTCVEAEYLALLLALRNMKLGEKYRVFSDSTLVVKQVTGEWEVRAPHLKKYCEEARNLMNMLDVEIKWIPRKKNISHGRVKE